MDKIELQKQVDELKPFFHYLNIDGVETKTTAMAGEGWHYPELLFNAQVGFWPSFMQGKKCLDIGCNAGFFSFQLAKRGAIVKGIDSGQWMNCIRQAKFLNEALGYSVEFVEGDFLDMTEENQYDFVLFLGVYYHLREPERAWPKLAQLIRPGGSIIVEGATADTTKRYGDTGEIYANDPTCYLVPTNDYVIERLVQSGFKVENIIPYHRFMVKVVKI